MESFLKFKPKQAKKNKIMSIFSPPNHRFPIISRQLKKKTKKNPEILQLTAAC